MFKQIINPATGEFTITNGFVVSNKTTVEELVAHFGENKMRVSDMKNGHCNYSTGLFKIDDLNFSFTFYFFNSTIKKVSFYLTDKSDDTKSGWDDFNQQEQIKEGKFMEQWMAKQMKGDFKKYDWGQAGTNYDHHNLGTNQ